MFYIHLLEGGGSQASKSQTGKSQTGRSQADLIWKSLDNHDKKYQALWKYEIVLQLPISNKDNYFFIAKNEKFSQKMT